MWSRCYTATKVESVMYTNESDDTLSVSRLFACRRSGAIVATCAILSKKFCSSRWTAHFYMVLPCMHLFAISDLVNRFPIYTQQCCGFSIDCFIIMQTWSCSFLVSPHLMCVGDRLATRESRGLILFLLERGIP